MSSSSLVPSTSPYRPELAPPNGRRSLATGPEPGASAVQWERYRAALLRYKWLVLAITLAGAAAGAVAGRFVKPEYEVHATIWISTETPQARQSGPIRAEQLMNVTTWPELLRSFTVLDRVVEQMRLYILPENSADSEIFAGFSLDERFRPGRYVLKVSAGAPHVALHTADGTLIEQITPGDSLGSALGFRWVPRLDSAVGERTVAFSVLNPRMAAIDLRERMGAVLAPNSNLMRLRLTGTNPDETTRTMNVLVASFVEVAAELKKRNLVEFASTLESQLDYAETELKSAEIALESFRVNTITLPSEGSPVAGGVEITRNPVFASFFDQKVELDNVRRDREALQRTLLDVQRGDARLNAFWAIPSVVTLGRDLSAGLNDFASREAALRALRQVYTDEQSNVKELQRVLADMQTNVIPPLVLGLIDQLRMREADLDARIGSASRELREIPVRTIEETRLKRNQEVRENLYTTLKSRYEEARLAEASSTPDVISLDRAAVPQLPIRTLASRILLLCIAGSAGFAVLLAILLDRRDARFRYPDQATNELGLTILGAVPAVGRKVKGMKQHEAESQVVEAFRSIRLSLVHAMSGAQPMMLTVSSPGAGDGKSMICSNLALSFAEAGYRTLLIDGDTRRGELHSVFGTDRRPGLIDYLSGEASIAEVIRATQHQQLELIPSGSRRKRGPELLASTALPQLLAMLRTRYDIILVDSPPLGAGIDPFALASMTGNLLMVLRAGATDLKMAQAKLGVMDRIPTRMLGAVVNDIQAAGIYRYYSYLYYGAGADEESLSYSTVGGPVSGGTWEEAGRRR